ncbi:hypothetical protein PSEUDO8BK_41053 [Pseudomonas sp. 8BK]|nr:hypothetical protein PSEUDO8BK_41053 [Pseudomonas sp. 8BK]
MPATSCATSASACTGTCRWGFEVDGGVEAGGQGLLKAGARLGFIVLSLSLARRCLPVTVLRNVDQVTISQLQGHFATQASQDLFAHEQAFTFEDLPLQSVEGNSKYLANKTFYDGDESAHKTGSEVDAVKSLNTVRQCFDLKADNLTKYCRHKFGLFHYGITDMPNY